MISFDGVVARYLAGLGWRPAPGSATPVVITITVLFSPVGTRSGSPPTRAAPVRQRAWVRAVVTWPGKAGAHASAMIVRSPRWCRRIWLLGRSALPGLRQSAAPWGSPRAAGADARGDSRSQAERAGCQDCGNAQGAAASGALATLLARDNAAVRPRRRAAGQRACVWAPALAARLGRPPGTVRGWLRTFAGRAEVITASARCWTRAIDPSEPDQLRPAGSPAVDAVDALGRMARACRLRLQLSASPWELTVTLTGLLYGRPRDPPGF